MSKRRVWVANELGGCSLGDLAHCWPATGAWWASRQGEDELRGPFGSESAAREWAGEPWVTQRERKQRRTWGTLEGEGRELRPGQVWGSKRKDSRGAQVLLAGAVGDQWEVYRRPDALSPWRSGYTLGAAAVLRFYQYEGTAEVLVTPQRGVAAAAQRGSGSWWARVITWVRGVTRRIR